MFLPGLVSRGLDLVPPRVGSLSGNPGSPSCKEPCQEVRVVGRLLKSSMSQVVVFYLLSCITWEMPAPSTHTREGPTLSRDLLQILGTHKMNQGPLVQGQLDEKNLIPVLQEFTRVRRRERTNSL